ncbi:collagen-binding domain-containing protein [Lactobacillus sp. LL6]|uniref:collagen-binding domain-containing protein n=1 Tax=Lactobacillus sp. LL6 TaxID=2596827 RepID=UPI001185AA2E|nr:collagen-binding domain-containing protein [Lactobacillus sp. LL6]TSO25341.1 hypothetical protein FOD82_08885 [Lactobacillus sp. LL6]
MNKTIRKAGIATMVSFTCLNCLSSVDVIYAAENSASVSVNKENLIPTQKVEITQNNATSQTGSKSGIYSDNGTLDNREYKTIGAMANYLDRENALGVASTFHIFAENINLNVDTNGNVATNNLNSNVDFGTRGSDTENNSQINNTQCDIHYIGHADNLRPNSFRNQQDKVVVNSETDIRTNKEGRVVLDQKDGNSFYIEQGNLNLNEVQKDNPDIKYIDIDSELNKLSKRADYWMTNNNQNSKGVKIDFIDENNRTIDITDADVSKDNFIFVNLSAKLLKNRPINIKGLGIKKNNKIPTVVINVTNSDKDLNIGTETKFYYRNSNQPLSNSEEHTEQNQILWNFGTQINSLSFNSGRFMGSILAPTASIFANVNIDGNIVGKEVSISGGESHRWDLISRSTDYNDFPHPDYPWNFIEEPSTPKDPKPNTKKVPVTPITPKNPKPNDKEIPVTPTTPKDSKPDAKEIPVTPTTPKDSKPDAKEIPVTPTTPEDSKSADEESPVTLTNETASTSKTESIFYPPLAKHGQDLDDNNLNVKKRKSCRKSVHSEAGLKKKLSIVFSMKNASHNKRSSNKIVNLKLTQKNYRVSTAKQFPATSEKSANVLSWIGSAIVSSLGLFNIIVNKRKNKQK